MTVMELLDKVNTETPGDVHHIRVDVVARGTIFTPGGVLPRSYIRIRVVLKEDDPALKVTVTKILKSAATSLQNGEVDGIKVEGAGNLSLRCTTRELVRLDDGPSNKTQELELRFSSDGMRFPTDLAKADASCHASYLLRESKK